MTRTKLLVLLGSTVSVGLILGAMIGWTLSLHSAQALVQASPLQNPGRTVEDLSGLSIRWTLIGALTGLVIGFLAAIPFLHRSMRRRTGTDGERR